MDALRHVEHDRGLFEFSIPRSWQHDIEKDGTQVFWDEGGGSGTLRVTSLTLQKDAEATDLPQLDLLVKNQSRTVRDDGVAWTSYRLQGEEDGQITVAYWWEFAHFLPPRYGRLAFFSFTIFAHEVDDARTQEQLRALALLPTTVRFGPLQNFELVNNRLSQP